MTLQYVNFTPKTSITVWTWRGQKFDLTGDLMSWQTQKSLSQPQGTFAISLTDAKHNGVDWAQNIKPMDYVEIRASSTGKTYKGQLPIIMRGFVDYAGHSFSIGQSGGPAEPRVIIQGRDYSKLLLEWQILYLWSTSQGGNIPVQQYGLLLNYGLPMSEEPLQQFFIDCFDTLTTPITQGIQKHWIKDIPSFYHNVKLPDYGMSTTNVMSYTGSYWNLLNYFVSPPFGEFFVRDDLDNPSIYARVTPYRTYTGITPTPGTELKPDIDIPTAEMDGYNLGWSDNDVYTYFMTIGDQSQLLQQSMPAFAASNGNGVQMTNQTLYGTRPLIIDSPWITYGSTTETPYQVADEVNQWLVQVMQDNNMLQSGTMMMHGREDYVIGKYGVVKDWDTEFYISGVSHQYTEFQTWGTTLQVVRGRPLSLGGSNNNQTILVNGNRAFG